MSSILLFFFLVLLTRFYNSQNLNFINQFITNLIFFLLFNCFLFYKINDVFLNEFSLSFLIFILYHFYYAGIRRSISIKMIFDLYNKEFSFNEYYVFFKKNSFGGRVNYLIAQKLFLKKSNYLYLSKKGLRIKKIFKFLQLIYGISYSG
jgi:hypothetical protein